MVELPRNTSNSKNIKDKETQFLLFFFILVPEIALLLLKKIKILTALKFLTIHSCILLIKTFFCT